MITLNLPSKTYLLGEYIVLQGEPCLILNTPPYFKAKFPSTVKNQFHPKSPVGLLLKKNSEFFKNYPIEFFDPHEGKGGFGASGAQFLAGYAALYGIQKNVEWLETLLNHYWDLLKSDNSVLTSGADLVAQVCGSFEEVVIPNLYSRRDKFREESPSNIVYWNRSKRQLDNFTWPFSDLSYCLIRTGYQCITHEKIKKLSLSVVNEMSHIAEQAYIAFQSKNSANFLEAIKSYADRMKKESCLLESTDELIQFLYRSNLIEAAKGCGALGADVVLILLPPEKMSAFLNWLSEHQIAVVSWYED